MRHRIDPKVDCVFKAILGKEENKNLLIHFLNAMLQSGKGERIRDCNKILKMCKELMNHLLNRRSGGKRISLSEVKEGLGL